MHDVFFRGVPDDLRRNTQSLQAIVPPESDDRYVFAALYVARKFIELDLEDAGVRAFLDIPHDFRAPRSVLHNNRMSSLGSTLFILRKSDGFQTFCDRLKKREIRETYYELVAARWLLDAGYYIFCRPETSVRGEDFDFQAVRGDEIINVEVTTIYAAEVSEKKIQRKLEKKRRQLPRGFASIIVCAVPESWLFPREEVQDRFRRMGERFLRGTRRVNGVLFYAEDTSYWQRSDGQFGGRESIANYFIENPNAAIPFKRGPPQGSVILTEDLWKVLTTGTNLPLLAWRFRRNEFHCWVDYCTIYDRLR